MSRAKETIDEKKLSMWKLMDDFRQRLAKFRAKMPPPMTRRDFLEHPVDGLPAEFHHVKAVEADTLSFPGVKKSRRATLVPP